MPRPRKQRRCQAFHGDRVFKPRSIRMGDLAQVRLGLDELEAMRLCDVDGLDQEAAGTTMGVSRGTIQRLLQSGHRKVVGALLDSSAIIIHEEGSDASLPANPR